MVPPWTRVYRIHRDIPMPLVTSGVEKGNLRELGLARMEDLGLKCRDVRTREAGIQDIHHNIRPDEVELVRRDYAANDGWETFLSYEDTRQEDVGIMKNMGFDAYRLSISWSRIFPDGTGKVNQEGVDYYNRLIDYMLQQGN
ncbi:hypothetical protein ZWY2020_043221 [Hordeum vulgare]|nr:hypothetical protein ZWY2020_043221 [Hordeum vulgare]